MADKSSSSGAGSGQSQEVSLEPVSAEEADYQCDLCKNYWTKAQVESRGGGNCPSCGDEIHEVP